MRRIGSFIGVLLVCTLAVACSKDKGLAEAAIKSAEEAVNSAGADASKFAADQWRGVTDALAAARDSFAKGDYKAALAGAQDVVQKAKDATAAAAAKKDQLTQAWNNASAGVPNLVEAVKNRVDILSQAKKLPAGLDKDKIEAAKAGLAAATRSWSEASDAFKAGNLADAAGKAGAAKDKALEAMRALGMALPPAAGG